MNKPLQNRLNAAKAQLKDMLRPKMDRYHFDLNRIEELEQKIKCLKMKITSIDKVNDTALFVVLDNGESAGFHQFGGTIYSTISEGLDKKDFAEFKKDIAKYEWNVDKLREVWLVK